MDGGLGGGGVAGLRLNFIGWTAPGVLLDLAAVPVKHK